MGLLINSAYNLSEENMHPSVNQSYTILFTDDIMDFNRSII